MYRNNKNSQFTTISNLTNYLYHHKKTYSTIDNDSKLYNSLNNITNNTINNNNHKKLNLSPLNSFSNDLYRGNNRNQKKSKYDNINTFSKLKYSYLVEKNKNFNGANFPDTKKIIYKNKNFNEKLNELIDLTSNNLKYNNNKYKNQNNKHNDNNNNINNKELKESKPKKELYKKNEFIIKFDKEHEIQSIEKARNSIKDNKLLINKLKNEFKDYFKEENKNILKNNIKKEKNKPLTLCQHLFEKKQKEKLTTYYKDNLKPQNDLNNFDHKSNNNKLFSNISRSPNCTHINLTNKFINLKLENNPLYDPNKFERIKQKLSFQQNNFIFSSNKPKLKDIIISENIKHQIKYLSDFEFGKIRKKKERDEEWQKKIEANNLTIMKDIKKRVYENEKNKENIENMDKDINIEDLMD